MSEIPSLLREGFRKCGFHNKTIEELGQCNNKSAIITVENKIAKVHNVFGRFRKKIKIVKARDVVLPENIGRFTEEDTIDINTQFCSLLYLYEVEEGDEEGTPFADIGKKNNARGFNFCKIAEEYEESNFETKQVFIKFLIFLRKGEQFYDGKNDIEKLCDRTDVFATEFIICFRKYMDLVKKIASGTSIWRDIVVDELHPEQLDIIRLLCSKKTIDKCLREHNILGKNSEIKNFDDFVKAENDDSEILKKYYAHWEKEHRVKEDYVRGKTLEALLALDN